MFELVGRWLHDPSSTRTCPQLSANRSTVTVTVGPTCSGTGCGALGQQTTNADYSFFAASTLTDTAGNTASTAARTQRIRMF
jgi:hypothetical protein